MFSIKNSFLLQKEPKKSHLSLAFACFFCGVFILEEILLFFFDPNELFIARFKNFQQSQEIIDQGLQFYTSKNIASFRIDDAVLLALIEKHIHTVIAPGKASDFANDPFMRMFSSRYALSDIAFSLRTDSQTKVILRNNESYLLYPPSLQSKLRDPWDDILIRSLYCDFGTYTERDFSLLQSLQDGSGDYFDTHLLLSLLFLKQNNCYDKNILKKNIDDVVQRIILSTKQDTESSDIYMERIVFLYWAGYGNRVEKKWIDIIRKNINFDSGWRTGSDIYSNAHTTGLALLALLYYQENKTQQIFYQ